MLPRLLIVGFGFLSGCLRCFLDDSGCNGQRSVQDGELCAAFCGMV